MLQKISYKYIINVCISAKGCENLLIILFVDVVHGLFVDVVPELIMFMHELIKYLPTRLNPSRDKLTNPSMFSELAEMYY